jgi:creatinine amidohydrolase
MATVMWKEMTAEDINRQAAAGAAVLLPVASIEQHGPHLPVGVDTILCEEVCKAAATLASRDTPVIVAPTLWCGMAEHHVAFGGTFTFDIPTYRAVLLSLLGSIGRAGFGKVMIVNGHGGNMSALNAFLPDFSRGLDLTVRATTYFMLANDRIGDVLDRQKSVMHACEVETSMMMAVAGPSVKPERLDEAHCPGFTDARSILASEMQQFRSFKTITPSGVIGDARTASAAKGEQLLKLCAEALAERLRDPALWSQG